MTWVDDAPTEVMPTATYGPTPTPWFTTPSPAQVLPQPPPIYAAPPMPTGNLLPAGHSRRRRRDHTKAIAVAGGLVVVAALVAFGASRELALNHAKANLASTQRALATSSASLTSTQTTLTTTQSTLTDMQSQLKTATADAAQAKSDIAAVQSQLSTAQASTAACKAFVGDADADVVLQSEFTTALGDGYDALLHGGDTQPFIDETDSLNNQIKALGVHYSADKAACIGAGSVGVGGSSNA